MSSSGFCGEFAVSLLRSLLRHNGLFFFVVIVTVAVPVDVLVVVFAPVCLFVCIVGAE